MADIIITRDDPSGGNADLGEVNTHFIQGVVVMFHIQHSGHSAGGWLIVTVSVLIKPEVLRYQFLREVRNINTLLLHVSETAEAICEDKVNVGFLIERNHLQLRSGLLSFLHR